MHQQIPLLIVFVTGVLMAFQYYIPHEYSTMLYENGLDWLQIIGIISLPLGIYSMVRVQMNKVQRRGEGWGFSVISLIGLFFMIFMGFVWERSGAMSTGTAFMWVFEFIYIPIQATMFSLLAFYIASAAYRAFRARSLLATIVLVSAVIVMIGRVPVGQWLSPLLPDIADWIMNVPNMAAQRAIMIGLGLGATATALKIILGIERSYMGRD